MLWPSHPRWGTTGSGSSCRPRTQRSGPRRPGSAGSWQVIWCRAPRCLCSARNQSSEREWRPWDEWWGPEEVTPRGWVGIQTAAPATFLSPPSSTLSIPRLLHLKFLPQPKVQNLCAALHSTGPGREPKPCPSTTRPPRPLQEQDTAQVFKLEVPPGLLLHRRRPHGCAPWAAPGQWTVRAPASAASMPELRPSRGTAPTPPALPWPALMLRALATWPTHLRAARGTLGGPGRYRVCSYILDIPA